MMVTNHSNKSPFRSAVIASSVALFAVLLIFIAILYTQEIFGSKEIVSATVTYDADPYNEGKSDPHTYTITDAGDIAFLTETLKEIKRPPGGVNCGFRHVVLHVVYEDGRKANFYLAGDSCPTIAKNNPDNGENHYFLPEERLYEFRKRISRYIPELNDDHNWWLEAVG
ncbi:MAG: hypothetical protein GXY43_05370 [Clostridiaceae bacterium]|nr:hypothetical protein [Clostridiaceae bacterium]